MALCADCGVSVEPTDVRYVNGRQVCASCGGGAVPVGSPRAKALLATGVLAALGAALWPVLVRTGLPLASPLIASVAACALVGLPVRLLIRHEVRLSDRVLVGLMALGTVVVGDLALFAMHASGPVTRPSVLSDWVAAVGSLDSLGGLLRFAIGPVVAASVAKAPE